MHVHLAPPCARLPGPLRRVWTTPELGRAVSHALDTKPSFFGDTACGTFLSVGGATYGRRASRPGHRASRSSTSSGKPLRRGRARAPIR